MPQQQSGLQEVILDTALEQAEASSWEQLQLHTVAAALHITLDDIRQYFLQKDDLVEAWFDRADRAMLGSADSAGPPNRPLQQRLHRVIWIWLDTLSPHRKLTREMLTYKLEPGHIHLQALGVMRISRTVQWFREAARQDSTGLKRILDECALTTIYLATFARWLFDDSEGSLRSREFLDTALRRWLGSGSAPDTHGIKPEGAAAEPEQRRGI
jgi:AcrR family transcriptional regulator